MYTDPLIRRVSPVCREVCAQPLTTKATTTYAAWRSKFWRSLDGAEDALITEMQHSVLGTRWVYDGLRDPRLVLMLAAVAMTGQGEALGMAVYDGRWYIAPSNVRITGGGWTDERVPVDGFELESDDAAASVFTTTALT